ncbi:MAG: hypothetical protein IJW21_00430 [Clostridia bacterium]|nr:hypothetical protein [Clostridia bacterium]
MKRYVSVFLCAALLLLLASCAGGGSALEITKDVSEHFAFRYGAVYSDEYGQWSEFCFSPELKTKIFGENAPKYTYIKAVSGYFSRDMVSGSELLVLELSDRSHRAEVMAVLYRRAALKQDACVRIFCEGNYVFFVCDSAAEEIIEYIKEKI